MELSNNSKIELCRHWAFSVVGGFFGAYAILSRGFLGSSQTTNLLMLLINTFFGNGKDALYHLVCWILYVIGTMLTVFIPKIFKIKNYITCSIIDILAAVILIFIPQGINPTVSLYPIFFAMAFQWSSFTGALGYNSSSIFSTNNVKQTFLGVAELICNKDKKQLYRILVFLGTLISFHIGAAISFFAFKISDLKSSLFVIPFVIIAFFIAHKENKVKEN